MTVLQYGTLGHAAVMPISLASVQTLEQSADSMLQCGGRIEGFGIMVVRVVANVVVPEVMFVLYRLTVALFRG